MNDLRHYFIVSGRCFYFLYLLRVHCVLLSFTIIIHKEARTGSQYQKFWWNFETYNFLLDSSNENLQLYNFIELS